MSIINEAHTDNQELDNVLEFEDMKDRFCPDYNPEEMAVVPRIGQRSRVKKLKLRSGISSTSTMTPRIFWEDLWAEIRDKDHVNGGMGDDLPSGPCYVVLARVDGERAMIPVTGNWSRLRGGGNGNEGGGAGGGSGGEKKTEPKLLNVKLELKQGRPPPQSYEEFLKDIVSKLTQKICCAAAQGGAGSVPGLEDMCKKDDEPEYLVNLSFVNKDDCSAGGPPTNYDDFLESVVNQLSRECPNQEGGNSCGGGGGGGYPGGQMHHMAGGGGSNGGGCCPRCDGSMHPMLAMQGYAPDQAGGSDMYSPPRPMIVNSDVNSMAMRGLARGFANSAREPVNPRFSFPDMNPLGGGGGGCGPGGYINWPPGGM